ncbi:MAG TPA: transposase, partial [Ktedonobacteraceae bacterium]|nr:transposase [Ktedonobacteraceae bacterium]
AVDDRSTSGWTQTHSPTHLGAQRVSPTRQCASALPMALPLHFCPACYWPDRMVSAADRDSGDLHHRALPLCGIAVGAGPSKRILLVLDRAGWHTSQELVVPEGIHLLFLPPYSPELQPCERLWPLSNEGIANRSFRTLDDLEEAQVQRCVVLQDQPEVIRSLTHFHWWPPSNSKHQ